MKRKYVRPMLEIETFHLSERISACDMKEENIPENIREAMSTIGFFPVLAILRLMEELITIMMAVMIFAIILLRIREM